MRFPLPRTCAALAAALLVTVAGLRAADTIAPEDARARQLVASAPFKAAVAVMEGSLRDRVGVFNRPVQGRTQC